MRTATEIAASYKTQRIDGTDAALEARVQPVVDRLIGVAGRAVDAYFEEKRLTGDYPYPDSIPVRSGDIRARAMAENVARFDVYTYRNDSEIKPPFAKDSFADSYLFIRYEQALRQMLSARGFEVVAVTKTNPPLPRVTVTIRDPRFVEQFVLPKLEEAGGQTATVAATAPDAAPAAPKKRGIFARILG